MAASVTHTKVSIVADSADTDDVRMSDWNANHTVSISAADVGAEASGAVATHAAAGDPHPVYETSTEAAAKVTTHAGAADPHGDRSFTTSAVSTHAGLSDPHTGYLQESAAAAVATSGSASDLGTGTLPIARIADGAVTLAKQADMATARIRGRTTAGTGIPEDLTVAQVITMLTGQVGGLPQIAVVASDQVFTVSNTTLQNVTGMTFTIGASSTEIWFVEAYLMVGAGNATMDAKFSWTGPASATASWGALSASSTVSGIGGFQDLAAAGSPLALGAIGGVQIMGTLNGVAGNGLGGMFFGGGTGGTVQLQCAQNTSDAANLTMKKGSMLRATKLVA